MKKIIFYALSMLIVGSIYAQTPKIALISSKGNGFDRFEAVANSLNASGLFSEVEVFNAFSPSGTPTLAELMNYDAVLVQGDASFASPVVLGNNMAAYAAAGGGVILSGLTLDELGGVFQTQLLGDWQNGDWDIVLNNPNMALENANCYDGIGTIHEPNHPIAAHADELEFTEYFLGYLQDPPVASHAVRVFDYALGYPLAYTSETLPNRVDIGYMVLDPLSCTWDGAFGQTNFLIDTFYYAAGATLGVENNTISDFKFSPNPVSSTIKLSSTATIENIEIYSILGKQVFNQKNLPATSQVDLSSLVSGVYIMKIKTNGQNGTYKLIKE